MALYRPTSTLVRLQLTARFLCTALLLPLGCGGGGGSGPVPPVTGTAPFVVQHYSHIRLANDVYAPLVLTAFEDDLLKNSIDFVMLDGDFDAHIHDLSPNTPMAIYANLSSIYLSGPLEDWLEYADANAHDREDMFFHASGATAWGGEGGSTQPVSWFHSVLQGDTSLTTFTTDAHDTGTTWALPNVVGQFCAMGYFEKFREINVVPTAGPSGGWGYVLEVPTAVDANKAPTTWAVLSPLSDTTSGLAANGRITFDPPAAWKACKIDGGTLNYYVRIRCTLTGTPPTIQTLLGRDWSGSAGGSSGTQLAFDGAADANKDGYLTDAEYAGHAPGKDARFLYESRLFTIYGAMRFVIRPTLPSVRAWGKDYLLRRLASRPLTKGIFMDNSSGETALASDTPVPLESVATFSQEYADLLSFVAAAIAPKFIAANTAGGRESASPVVAAGIHYTEEALLRPLEHTWQQFANVVELLDMRAAASAQAAVPPMGVLDTRSGGDMSDPRALLAALSYFYVVANPAKQFLVFWGGEDPAGAWSHHWCDAVKFDVGAPTSAHTEWATGQDPEDPTYEYRVYRRDYANAVVLYKPLSWKSWSDPNGTLSSATATTHALGGSFRKVAADGTLGPVVTSVTLRNGEGAILAR